MKHTHIVNLTPHDVVLRTDWGETTFPKSGKVARVTETKTNRQPIYIDGLAVPFVKTSLTEVIDLPEPEEGTIYLVSLLVAQAVKGIRSDVLSPDTGKTCIRNDKGMIEAVVQLTSY